MRSGKDTAGVTTTFEYDDLGRRTKVTDGRGNHTVTGYDSAGRVDTVTVKDAAGADATTTYAYYGDEEGSNTGRLAYVQNPQNPATKKTRYDYTARGVIAHIWGEVPQPTWFEYDDFGQRTKLHTYRGGTNEFWSGATWPDVGDGDVTQWEYENSTGLLTKKSYADGSEVLHTYTPANRPYQRTWAREVNEQPLVTTYSFDSDNDGSLNDETGELAKIDYSDSTPDVTYTYNRAGQPATVLDGTGTRTLSYDPNTLEFLAESLPSFFGDRVVTRTYLSGALGQLDTLQVGTTNDPDADYLADYDYDGTTGRTSRLTGPGLPTGGGTSHGVFYFYLANSNLVEMTEYRDSGGANLARTTRTFEPHRDLIAQVENKWGATNVSTYNYDSDALGRRTEVIRTGSAFAGDAYSSPPHKDRWSYNARNELTGSMRYGDTSEDGTTNHDATRDYGYEYDPIGNRTRYDFWQGDAQTGEGSALEYDANGLNQYERTKFAEGKAVGQKLAYDADGNLTGSKVIADMNCDGSVNPFDVNGFMDALEMDGCATYYTHYPNCDCLNGDMNGDGSVNPFDIQPFVSALGGLGGEEPIRQQKYVWDAENRLAAVEPPGAPGANAEKWVYTYDYMSRRVAKQKFTRNSGNTAWKSTPDEDTRFVYDGWNVIEEIAADVDHDGTLDFTPVRKYTWGLDLAGQDGSVNSVHAAGGIGGLLSVDDTDPATPQSGGFAYSYDANGNVGQVLNVSSGAVAVKYEYDPYGNRITQPAASEFGQPFRFSTNWLDDEPGFMNGKQRLYIPRVGRWLSRDPSGERGWISLYAGLRNSPIEWVDPDGGEELSFSQQAPRPPTTLPAIPSTQSTSATTSQAASQPCCVCGPDITSAVDALMSDIDAKFATFKSDNPSRVSALCDAYINSGTWDSDLYTLPTQFTTANCPKGGKPCALDFTTTGGKPGAMGGMPVTYKGKCYASFDVNYVVYGRMAKNCDNLAKAELWFVVYKNSHAQPRFQQALQWLLFAFFGEDEDHVLDGPADLKKCAACAEKWSKPIRWRAGAGVDVVKGTGGQP